MAAQAYIYGVPTIRNEFVKSAIENELVNLVKLAYIAMSHYMNFGFLSKWDT